MKKNATNKLDKPKLSIFWYTSTKKITSKDKDVKEKTGPTCKDESSVTVKTDEDQQVFELRNGLSSVEECVAQGYLL